MIDWVFFNFVGMVYEIIIISIATILLLLILKKHLNKRHDLTFKLFLVFLNWELAIIFICLAKVLYLYSGFDWITNESVSDPGTVLSWLFLRIYYFRFSMIFATIGILLSYQLKDKIFQAQANKNRRLFFYAYSCFIIVVSLILYEKGNVLLDLFLLVLIVIFMGLTYFPFMYHSIKASKSVDDIKYRKAFLSLAFMAFCLLMVFICFLLDQIVSELFSTGFTVFYFTGWAFAIFAMVGAYLGYVKPRGFEKK